MLLVRVEQVNACGQGQSQDFHFTRSTQLVLPPFEDSLGEGGNATAPPPTTHNLQRQACFNLMQSGPRACPMSGFLALKPPWQIWVRESDEGVSRLANPPPPISVPLFFGDAKCIPSWMARRNRPGPGVQGYPIPQVFALKEKTSHFQG